MKLFIRPAGRLFSKETDEMNTGRFTPVQENTHTMPKTMYAESETMIARGELYSACLDPVVGSEQGGVRPVLVIQNDVGNRFSPTVIVLAVTGQMNKAKLPTHVQVTADGNGLQKDSVVLAEQIRTLDKRRLKERIGSLTPEQMDKVTEAVKISLGFPI